jgi:uncharacterized protein YegL
MKQFTTEIVCIIDRSGSMNSIRSDAVGGFNRFLEDQKAIPDPASLTLIQFDDFSEIIHERTPLHLVPPLHPRMYRPRGRTALLDAVGQTVSKVGNRIAKTPKELRPAHVIVAVLTDGMENASRSYTRAQIFKMITRQQTRYDWNFIFLAANQDAICEGNRIGIHRRERYNWRADSIGTREAFASMSARVRQSRVREGERFFRNPLTERNVDKGIGYDS